MPYNMYCCSKCNGTGDLPAHRNVAGGVCFKCNGTGKQRTRPNPPTRKWLCVYAGVGVFTKGARSEKAALRLAVTHWKLHKDAVAFANVKSEKDITVTILGEV